MAKFIDELNEALKNSDLRVTVEEYVEPYDIGWFVRLIEGDKVIAHIRCIRYTPRTDGSTWVGINSFTLESHRNRGLNLFLRAVVMNVLHNIFKEVNMYLHSSIVNKVSLNTLRKYFVIDWRASDIKHNEILYRTYTNIDRSNEIICKFLKKIVE